MDLIEQIEEYVYEARLLSHIIEKSNYVIDGLEGEPELKIYYIKQLQPTIEEYRGYLKALKFLFDEYFKWEKLNSKTRNLRYKRLYNLVLEDLNKPIPPISK